MSRAFGPRRLIPEHLLWLGLIGVLLTAAVTAAVTFLSHMGRRR